MTKGNQMKIEAYIMVRSPSPEALEKRVNEFIKDGFQPYGNLVIAPIQEGEIIYIQPMTKSKG
jgi:Domain of unknown function (DUF1737)